jgi:hypothetical protein
VPVDRSTVPQASATTPAAWTTDEADSALAEATKDSDLAIDPRQLLDDPRIEEAMIAGRFYHDLVHPQPGSWLSCDGIPSI